MVMHDNLYLKKKKALNKTATLFWKIYRNTNVNIFCFSASVKVFQYKNQLNEMPGL